MTTGASTVSNKFVKGAGKLNSEKAILSWQICKNGPATALILNGLSFFLHFYGAHYPPDFKYFQQFPIQFFVIAVPSDI
jgi:hypothetical protein